MKHISTQSHAIRWVVGIAALAFLTAATAQVATVQVQDEKGGYSTVKAHQIVVTDGDETGKHSIEIRVDGDQVRVIRDGEEVPQAQLTQEDGQVVITDKDGNRIQALSLKVKPGEHAWAFGGESDLLLSLVEGPGPTPKVMLGVQMAEPEPALIKHLRLKPGETTIISGVYEGLPADKAGITEYDIIVKIDGETPADNATMRKLLAEKEPGGTVALTLIHEGKTTETTVKLLAYDHEALSAAKYLGSDEANMAWGRFSAVEGTELPTWQGSQVFVAPGLPLVERMERMPQIQNLQELNLRLGRTIAPDIEERLRALDERLAELDKTIQRLIEQRAKER